MRLTGAESPNNSMQRTALRAAAERHDVGRTRMSYAVDFESMPWETPAQGIRQKVHRVGARALRLVEYSETMPPHWCTAGHVGHIVAGSLEIEFKTGVERFQAGDALFIPEGPAHAHRAVLLTATAVALFVEDA